MTESEVPPIGSFPLYLPEALAHFESVARKPPLPAILYHYTTADGLLGILQTQRMWATNVRYMNDASELEYGRDLVATEISTALGNHGTLLDRWLSEFPAGLARAYESAEHFTACFCESGDLLSQWRAYGAGGFSLGVGAASLSRLQDASIVRVEYDPEIQRAAIRKTIHIHLHQIRDAVAHKQSRRINEVSAQFALMLTFWAMIFKHPTFREEREWRIVPLIVSSPVRFRSAGLWLKPYIEIPLAPPDSTFDLRSITHAPSMTPDLTKRSLKLLTAGHGLKDVQILGSSAPLRL